MRALVLLAFVGCGAAFWQDDPAQPTDIVHDPIQGNPNGGPGDITDRPLFAARKDAGTKDATGD